MTMPPDPSSARGPQVKPFAAMQQVEHGHWAALQGTAALLAVRSRLDGGVLAAQHDVRQDPAYQTQDIDLLVGEPDGRHLGLEAKMDQRASGQLPFEIISNAGRRTPGWLWYCQAHRLVFVRPAVERVLVLDWPTVRRAVLQSLGTHQLMETSTPIAQGRSYSTVCRLVTVAWLRELRRPRDGAPALWEMPLMDLPTVRAASAAQQAAWAQDVLRPDPRDAHGRPVRAPAPERARDFLAQEADWLAMVHAGQRIRSHDTLAPAPVTRERSGPRR